MTDTTKTQSLFAKLGGGPTVRAVVNKFYEKVMADELLAPMFAGSDMQVQKAHQAAFIGMALGGPKDYSGRNMTDAHKGRGIKDAHFGAVAGHLVSTLEDFGVEQADINTIVTTVSGLKPDIVGH